jgi:hypothetical protein
MSFVIEIAHKCLSCSLATRPAVGSGQASSGVWPGHYSLYSRSHSAPCVFSESIGKIYPGVFRVCQRAPLIAWPEMVALVHAKCFPAREAGSLERLIVGLRKAGLAAC